MRNVSSKAFQIVKLNFYGGSKVMEHTTIINLTLF